MSGVVSYLAILFGFSALAIGLYFGFRVLKLI